jgi:hypothetical protein
MMGYKMNTYHDLKGGLAFLAKRAKQKQRFKDNIELATANERALKLFTQPGPVWGRETPDSPLINLTYTSLFRINLLLRKNGIDWPLFDWQALLDWLYANWDKVLRVIMSLLALLVI